MTLPSIKRSVFVSYSRQDGRETAERLRAELSSAFTVWQDVVAMQGGEDWWQQIKTAIEGAESLVLLLTPKALESPFVRREWVHARRVGTPILPVVLDEEVLKTAPRWVGQAHVFILDPDYQDYKDHHARFWEQLQTPQPTSPIVNLTPPLPDTFVERPLLHAAIRDRLLSADHAEPRFGVTSLLGAGGFGKTNLAQGIGNDPDIVEAFTGGVFWVTVGESGQALTQELNAVLRALKKPEATADDAPLRVREALADLDALLILDDVWDRGKIAALMGLPNAHILLTTRDPGVAALCDRPLAIGEMQTTEAAAMLLKYLPSGYTVDASVRTGLRTLAERLGEWPLLLNLFGAVLREQVVIQQQSLAAALEYVNEGLQEEGLHVFDRGDAGRSAALTTSMAVSLRGFSDDERQRLYELSIFPDDVVVSAATALALWRGTAGLSDFKGRKLLARFSGGFTLPEAESAFRLHDRMREYLAGALNRTDPNAGREAHAALIAAWGDLITTPLPDSYPYRYLGYHRVEAGQIDEMRALLFDGRWLALQLEHADLSALLADIDRLPIDEDLRLLRSALGLSAHRITERPEGLVSQLSGRLFTYRDRLAIVSLLDSLTTSRHAYLQLLNAGLLPAGGPLLRILAGHTDDIKGARELLDGRLLSWGHDGTVRFWSSQGDLLATVDMSASPINSICQLRASRLLSWHFDGSLRLWEADGTPLKVLNGHTKAVHGALELPDGRLLSWSFDSTLRLWSAEGQGIQVLKGHTALVSGVTLLHDGRLLSWSEDHTLCLWSLDGTFIHMLKGHTQSVSGAIELPDGRLLSWSADNSLKLWSSKGELLKTFGSSEPVSMVILLRDNRLLPWNTLISSRTSHKLHIWSSDGELLNTLTGHNGSVTGVCELSDGRLLSWSWDRTLRLWSTEGEPLAVLEGHQRPIDRAMELPDGRWLSWSADNILLLWSAQGEPLTVFNGHTDTIWQVLTLSNGHLLSWSRDRTLRLWSTREEVFVPVSTSENSVVGLGMMPDGRVLAWMTDGMLSLFSLEGKLLHHLNGHTQKVEGALIEANGSILSWSRDHTLRLWAADGTSSAVLKGHARVKGALSLPDKRTLSWSENISLLLCLWDANGSPHRLDGHSDWVNGVLVTKDGRLLSWSSDKTLRLWSAEGEPIQVLEGHVGRVEGALELDDGRFLSWGDDGTLRLWSVDGLSLGVLEGHQNAVYGVMRLASGILLSWSRDRTLRQWSQEGQAGVVLEGHNAAVMGVTELPNQNLLSWSDDPELILWSDRGDLLFHLKGHTDPINGALALLDGRLLSWSDDGSLRLWTGEGRLIDVFYADASINAVVVNEATGLVYAGDGQGRVLALRLPGV